MAAEADGITYVELRGDGRRRLEISGVQAVAAFLDQVWVATRDGVLHRLGIDGRRLDEHALPADPDAILLPTMQAPVHLARTEWVSMARNYYHRFHALNAQVPAATQQRHPFQDNYTPPQLPAVVPPHVTPSTFKGGYQQGMLVDSRSTSNLVVWKPFDDEKCWCINTTMSTKIKYSYSELAPTGKRALEGESWASGQPVTLKSGDQGLMIAGYSKVRVYVMVKDEIKLVPRTEIQ